MLFCGTEIIETILGGRLNEREKCLIPCLAIIMKRVKTSEKDKYFISF